MKSDLLTLTRTCPNPDCGKVIQYKNQLTFHRGTKRNKQCKTCSNIGKKNRLGCTNSPETRRKLAVALVGNQNAKNAIRSESYRLQKRLKRNQQIERLGGGTNSNPLATHVFHRLNQELGWNGQHKGNGGEKRISGYFVDYFEPTLKLVLEWDEPKHFHKKNVEKDTLRQERILRELGDGWKFLRFDQANGIFRDDLYHV